MNLHYFFECEHKRFHRNAADEQLLCVGYLLIIKFFFLRGHAFLLRIFCTQYPQVHAYLYMYMTVHCCIDCLTNGFTSHWFQAHDGEEVCVRETNHTNNHIGDQATPKDKPKRERLPRKPRQPKPRQEAKRKTILCLSMM